ncbi:hypothetical protein [Candidatus Bathycorpusculum sp.]|uniref:hypothetical protein n=1 Tax=Candidatus Bathycorpusculum sp. TaxID=2994959 RepID=UPI0028248FD7|nr:hypothetical protein [Candidatus Termitimicrobium sp.]MCL2432782.1 hypothetical protein [Candidatus Termitimicrobium sp.]
MDYYNCKYFDPDECKTITCDACENFESNDTNDPFTCKVCGKQFNPTENNMLTLDSLKHYQCPSCDGVNDIESADTQYQFMCEACGKQFNPTENNRVDIKNAEQYQCPVCNNLNVYRDDEHITNKTGNSY